MSSVRWIFAFACARAFTIDEPAGLILLQTRVDQKSASEATGDETLDVISGKTSSLDEEGYQSVVALKNDDEMKDFVQRVLVSEGRSVRDNSGLSGVTPFFSGTKAAQSYDALRRELASAAWVNHGVGRTAALSTDGFLEVLALQDARQMKAFTRRVLADISHERVMDDAKLNALAESISYDGVSTEGEYVQDLDALRSVLRSSLDLKLSGKEAFLSQDGYMSVLNMNNDTEMRIFAQRVLQSEGRYVADEVGFNSFVHDAVDIGDRKDWDTFLSALRDSSWVYQGIGRTASLSEDGYQKVAASHSGLQMKLYAGRILTAAKRTQVDDSGLSGLVPYFDGEYDIQTFARLTQELYKMTSGQGRTDLSLLNRAERLTSVTSKASSGLQRGSWWNSWH